MVQKLYYFESMAFDPHANLAAEQYLLEHLQPGEHILYLWQNQNTVVIGANQNAWAECRVSLLEEEGGKLARRLSGGGAVFHDLGNLNFTFLTKAEDYDVDKQLSVIACACKKAGIAVEKSGRNDMLADGRKFSGNAFYHSKGNAYHHGTLLINADVQKMQRYLSPSKAKLEAKGVSSVRSRVVNLQELCPTLTIARMKQLMLEAYAQVYGLAPQQIQFTEKELQDIQLLRQKNASWDHLFGAPLSFTFQCERRFVWGNLQLDIQAKGGVIQAVKVYSDAMDWQLPQTVENALTGCRFTKPDMCQALDSTIADKTVRNDLCQWIAAQDI